MLAYGYQFHSVTAVLNEAGISTQDFINSMAVNRVGEGWLNLVSIEDVRAAYSGYFASMVGASGALYGIIVAFAFMFPNVPLFLIFIPIPIKAKYFVPLLILGDLFFRFFFLFNRAYCTLCSCRGSSDWLFNDVLLEEKSV